MAMNDFGEVFAAKVTRRFFADAVTPAITNSNYEGQLKQMGDRLNMLSFPGMVQTGDYVAGTDMSTFAIYDLEDVLIVEKRKYYNFPIDRLENLFTYVDDASETLVESASRKFSEDVDRYVLEQAQFSKAGSWIGIDLRVTGSSRDTEASIATTATGGTVTIDLGSVNGDGTIEHGDGTLDYGGFDAADVGKPIRLTSGTTWATSWYRITAVTDSVTATVENWDAATEAMDIPNGDVLRGLGGSLALTGGQINTDGKVTTEGGWGWELQAARSTTISSTTIYNQMTLLAEKLDENEIPQTDRHVSLPDAGISVLKQSATMTPAIEIAYNDIILNGRIGKVAGFDVHQASGFRVSTRVEHPTSTGQGADTALTTGARAHLILANHISFCTFAHKWQESRVIDAESQFAKKYQGLNLYGAKVAGIRRASGALLFGKL
uniref:Putative coat protein n=1 Tax=viral metagenome TaxID=1070528 RepID=A0A6H1ZDY8_9ZZZZ